MTDHTPHPVPDGRIEVNGATYMADAEGALVPVELIKAETLLEDETVRKIMRYAMELSEQVARFKAHTFDDIGALDAILDQERRDEGRAQGQQDPDHP